MSARHASYAIDPPAGARPWHYLAAMLLVGCAFAGAVHALDHPRAFDVPSETQDALLVDLPPSEAGASPPGDDAPPQAAAPSAAGAAAAPKPDIPKVEARVPPKPALVEIPRMAPPRPAPAAAPQEAHLAAAPPAAPTPDTEADDAETHRASAHLITLWQKALMARLQAARHALPHQEHVTGHVEVAFAIDRDGRLVSERVARGSGAAETDAAALVLVRLAAPFPAPPKGAGAAQLSFVVPITFKR